MWLRDSKYQTFYSRVLKWTASVSRHRPLEQLVIQTSLVLWLALLALYALFFQLGQGDPPANLFWRFFIVLVFFGISNYRIIIIEKTVSKIHIVCVCIFVMIYNRWWHLAYQERRHLRAGGDEGDGLGGHPTVGCCGHGLGDHLRVCVEWVVD